LGLREKSSSKQIFDFDGCTGFTVRSKRYQAVISFFSSSSSEGHDGYFKITKVQDIMKEEPILFDVNPDLTPSENKKRQHNRFSIILDDLEEWKLIASRGAKNDKDGADTKEYKITNVGRIFALIIKYYNSENKHDVYEEFYDKWMLRLEKFQTSLGLFISIYSEKCKSNGVFNILVDNYIHSSIREWNARVRNENDMLTQMALLKTNATDKNKVLLGLWLDSLYELDYPVMYLFLNHMRIHLNRIIEKRVEEVNKYELKRYEKRNLDNQIIAEFQCTFCNFPQYMEFPVVIYLKRFFDKENKDIDELIAEMKCDNCGDDGLTLNQII
jgi:hypothetical protein